MPDSDPTVDTGARRLTILTRVLESFTATLDLDEVLLRIVNTALEELGSDRAWVVHLADLNAETAHVVYEVTRDGWEGAYEIGLPIPLAGSRELLRKARERGSPVSSRLGDTDVDQQLWERFSVRSRLLQVMQTNDGDLWAFGLHQCSYDREWSPADVDLFHDIGRYASIALNNALLHRRALREAATVGAVIDHIPEAVAIYDAEGELRRVNPAARTHMPFVFGPTPPTTTRSITGDEESLRDPRTGEDRTVRIRTSPFRDREGMVLGSVVIASDITEERQRMARDEKRRSRAECLAYLGVDLFADPTAPIDLNDSAAVVAEALDANVAIYLHVNSEDNLQLFGAYFRSEQGQRFRRYVESSSYRPGEGLPGTVFEMGQPLLFAVGGADAAMKRSRDTTETELLQALGETSVIAAPVESYGERIGAIVISTSDSAVSYEPEDVDFVEAVAQRIGAAVHIHQLTRIAQEGHRAAEELARREVEARGRLEAVIESAPAAIAVVSAEELRFESTNPPWNEYASRFGKVRVDTRLTGLRVADVIPGLERVLARVAESGETMADDALEVRRGDEIWYVRQVIAPVRGRLPGITQSLTILVQDVTEQVRTNREIEALAQIMEERSARLTSILGSMTDALLVYDASGHVIDVNPAALSLFGIGSRSEAITRGSLADMNLRYPDGAPVPPNDMPYIRALRGEVVPDYLAIGRHLITGRDLDLSIAAAPIESTTVVGAVLVIRDISALQELDRKKDEFLSVASHELRTPLTTIRGYAQLLAQTISEIKPEEQAVYLRAVLGEIDRMMGLITDLLDVSRIETNRLQITPAEIRWNDFIARRIAALRIRTPGREISLSAPAEEIIVTVDADRMRQVIDNLLSNAVKYSADEAPIDVEIVHRGDHLATTVRDRGIGIPQEEVSRLFDRFHRASNVSSRYYAGLGLGLYIARAIVEAHGGTIDVLSSEGEGSEFTITLPLGR